MKLIEDQVHARHTPLGRYTVFSPEGKVLKRFKTIEGVLKYFLITDLKREQDFSSHCFTLFMSGGLKALQMEDGRILVHVSWLRQQAHNHVHGFKSEPMQYTADMQDFKALSREVKQCLNTLKS